MNYHQAPTLNKRSLATVAASRYRLGRRQVVQRTAVHRIIAGLFLLGLAVSSATAVRAGNDATSATPVTPGGGGSPAAVEQPADLQLVNYQPCDVTPRDFDTLMVLLATATQDPAAYPSPPPWLTPSVNPRPGPGGRYFLPDGPSPSPDTVETLVQLLGTFESCTPLQRAALRPDDLLVRAAFGEDGARMIAGWWRDAHRLLAPPTARDSRIGTPTIYQLYDFRTIDATHVGAYVELTGGIRLGFAPAAGTYQPTWEQAGYIVFTQGPDGRWLVDSFVSPLGSVINDLFPAGSATPAP